MEELLSASKVFGSTVFSTNFFVTSSDSQNIGLNLCLLGKFCMLFWQSADPPPQIILFKNFSHEYMYYQC